MNFDLPIEQIVRRADTRFQLSFAAEARERLPRSDAFALVGSRRGLHVLARNEDGLSEPLAVLRSAYGDALQVGPPTVRLMRALEVQEPIMHVRISLEAKYREAAKAALAARNAILEGEHEHSGQAVLRYEAALMLLLGLPRELTGLTSGTARYWIVLSHYAPVKAAQRPGSRRRD